MDKEDTLRDLIGRSHAAALEPGRWADLAECISDAYGRSPVSLILALPESHVEPIFLHAGYDPARPQPVFTGRFTRENPLRTPASTVAACRGFILARDFVSEDDLRASEYYRDWMEPLALAPDALIATFGLEREMPAAVVSVFRYPEREPFGAEDAAFGDLLFPHLRRAYRIYRRLGGMERETGALAEVIYRLPAGVVLLDARRRVVLVNPNAQHLIDLRDGFLMDDEGPRLSYPHEDEPFQEAVNRAIEAVRRGPDQVLVGTRPSGRPPLLVGVTRLLEPAPGSPIDSAVAAIFLGNASEPRPVSRNLLIRLYSLTPAEADLVSLLCDGLSLERAAERRGVRVSTVRWQVKQVFSKTGTRSQADLVRLVLGATAPIMES